jgi:Ca2+-binding RTX toxin-like protein
MNGTNFTDMTANIVIKDNIVHDTMKDGIKVSHGDYVYVVDNTVSHAGDQGIDFVAVNNSVIARNDVSYITGSAPALFVKAGSTNILIALNHVSHAASDGIAVGGWTGGSTWMRPGFTEWQAKNVLVIDNHVEDCGKRPLNILGGQDSQIIHNWLESNPDYYYVVTIAPDDSTPSLNSKNILLKDNAFDRGDHWLQVLPGQEVGLQVVGNRFDNIFQGATGPHSGDLDYDLAWLPNDGDHLLGTAGADTLNGGAGADTMAGGLGNDTYSVDTVGDVVTEADNAGIDTVRSWISYTLGSNLENLTLVGSANINATGNALNNVLTGNGGNNFLNGGAGADTMAGGLGNDTVFGGSGDDQIDVSIGNDTVRCTSALDGSDVINGFDGNPTGGQDVLNLDALFDSLGIAAATRADHLSIDTHATSVDVRFDADGNDANGFELTIATLNTADAITVGSDVIVGT